MLEDDWSRDAMGPTATASMRGVGDGGIRLMRDDLREELVFQNAELREAPFLHLDT